MLGNGDGTFQPEYPILSGTNFSGLAPADFNGDGKLDLIVSDYGFPAINVLFGKGDGTFQSAISYSVGIGPISLPVADLNHDGRPDIAVANFNSNTVDILLNRVTQTAKLSHALVPGVGQQSVTASYPGDTHFATSTSQSVPLSANTVVKLVPISLSFGDQLVGTTSTAKAVTMTNVGTTALTINGISLTGINAGDFSQTHTCGGTLGAGASCTISVKFHPSATGARSAAVSISDNGGGSPQKVPLSGTGT